MLVSCMTAFGCSSMGLRGEDDACIRCRGQWSERRLGEHSFYLCHATPSNPLFGYLDKDAEQWISEVHGAVANIVVVGHTHVPFLRAIGNQTLINPGSLGQAKVGAPQACYVVWEDGQLELRRYTYPIEETKAHIAMMTVSETVKANLMHVLDTGVPLPPETL